MFGCGNVVHVHHFKRLDHVRWEQLCICNMIAPAPNIKTMNIAACMYMLSRAQHNTEGVWRLYRGLRSCATTISSSLLGSAPISGFGGRRSAAVELIDNEKHKSGHWGSNVYKATQLEPSEVCKLQNMTIRASYCLRSIDVCIANAVHRKFYTTEGKNHTIEPIVHALNSVKVCYIIMI